MTEIILWIGGGVSGIIGFFLVRLINDHDKTKALVIQLQTEVALLKNNHGHHTDSMDKLNKSIEKLTDKIDDLTKVVNAQ